MKVLRIPCFLLLLLLVLALGNSVWLSRRCDSWLTALDRVDHAAQQENWDDARQQLEALYQDWNSVQTWLHVIITHEELNTAQSLFCTVLVLGEEEDDVEFRAHVAELRSQLQLLAEMERVSIKNVL